MFHARTKQIEIDYHFIREKVLRKDIVVEYITSEDQQVDFFTKGLSSSQFLKFRSKLLFNPPNSLREGVTDYRSSTQQLNSIVSDNSQGHVESASSRDVT